MRGQSKPLNARSAVCSALVNGEHTMSSGGGDSCDTTDAAAAACRRPLAVSTVSYLHRATAPQLMLHVCDLTSFQHVAALPLAAHRSGSSYTPPSTTLAASQTFISVSPCTI